MATDPQNSSSADSELIVAIVAAVGTDQDALCLALTDELAQLNYSAETIHLSRLLNDMPGYAARLEFKSEGERYDKYMEAGTCLREATDRGDALAMLAIMAIRERRNISTGDSTRSNPRSAFILRSLKHPREVDTLRKIYGSNFVLISAYTAAEKRFHNLAKKISASKHQFQGRESFPEAQTLLLRDEAEQGRDLGQQVRKTFPLGDVFIDTSSPARSRESVKRFMEALFGYPFHTPTRDEVGMFHAQAAGYRSAALGRQVGAAITTPDGDVVVVGTNEVPKAGGGLYWAGDTSDERDFVTGRDINDELKRRLLADVLSRLQKAAWLDSRYQDRTVDELLELINADSKSPLNDAQILDVIEYGRCVHAEMNAIVDAARRGVPVAGSILYTTTFPCHECARHIVAAGVRKVLYVDPYPKSLVSELYPDSIVVENDGGTAGRIPFLPFVGFAPRVYMSLFQSPPRKQKGSDGKVIGWVKSKAVPRYSEFPYAVKVREEAEVEKFIVKMKSIGLGPEPENAISPAKNAGEKTVSDVQ